MRISCTVITFVIVTNMYHYKKKSMNFKVELTFSVLETEHIPKSKCDIIHRFLSPLKMSFTQYQQNKGNACK